METLQDFICNCLGISPSICKMLDKTEKKFRIWEYYNLDEELLIEIIKRSLEPENRNHAYLANMLIANYYQEIINHTIEAYCDYPELTEELFQMDVDGYYSSLSFNNQIVKSKQDLDNTIQDWIIKTQKQ